MKRPPLNCYRVALYVTGADDAVFEYVQSATAEDAWFIAPRNYVCRRYCRQSLPQAMQHDLPIVAGIDALP
jgi:hypothetical protein